MFPDIGTGPRQKKDSTMSMNDNWNKLQAQSTTSPLINNVKIDRGVAHTQIQDGELTSRNSLELKV